MLKPDYKHGLISVGAENLVLQALDAEIAAATKENLASLDVQLVGSLDNVASKKRVYSEAREFVIQASRLRACQLTETKATQQKPEVDSLVDLYYALEKAGIIHNDPDEAE